MSELFSVENKFFKMVSKLIDLVVLNILWIVLSLPVITMGAATSALYYVVLKMVNDEEGYVIRSFFKAFRKNLKQGVIMQLIFFIVGVVIIGDIRYFLLMKNVMGYIGVAIFGLLLLFYFLVFLFAFPLMAKFENTVTVTLKNAFVMSQRHLSYSIAMLILFGCIVYGVYVSVPVMIIALLIGASAYTYVSSILFRSIFTHYSD